MEGDNPIDASQEEQVLESGVPSDTIQHNNNAEDTRNNEDFGDPETPGESANTFEKREYANNLNEYSKEMIVTLRECGYKLEELWVEFTTAFRPSAIKVLTGTQQTSWVRLLKQNGVYVEQRRGLPKWKALKTCLLSPSFPVGVVASDSDQNENNNVGIDNNNQEINVNINRGQGSNTLQPQQRSIHGIPTTTALLHNTPSQPRASQQIPGNRAPPAAVNPSNDYRRQRNNDFHQDGPTAGQHQVSLPGPSIDHAIAPQVATRDNRQTMIPSRSPRIIQNNSRNNSGNNNINVNNINSMMKAYQGRTKFKGTFDDDFEGALEKFETYASIYQLNDEEKARTFPFMIDEGALSHFTHKFSRRSYTYEEVITSFREWYTSEEQRTRLLLVWQNPSILDAMRQDPDKSELEIFRKMVDKLTAIQRQLHPSYREDRFLRDQLVVSADITHLRNSLREKVPKTAQEAINRIASQLSNEPKSAGAHFTNDTEDDANYSLGRRFGGQARKSYSSSGNRDRNKTSFSRKLASVRGCWVCKKKHRARDHHSRSEVLDAINKFRKSQESSALNAGHLDDFEWALHDMELSDSDDDTKKECNHEEKSNSHSDSDSSQLALLEESDKAMIYQLTNNSYLHSISDISPIGQSSIEATNTQNIGIIEMDHGLLTKEKTFLGVIIDTGANRSSVMCYQQYRAYCETFMAPLNIDKRESKGIKGLFGASYSLGTAIISIPFKDLDLVIHVKFRIMKEDCESLFCLRDLKENGLNLDVQRNKILYKSREQNLSFVNDFLVHKWTPKAMPYVLYTESELRKLHRNFGHPTVSALKRVLKRANPSTCDNQTKKAIHNIVESCRTCQQFSSKPKWFKLTIGTDDLQFNHIIAADIMYIHNKPILHVVDEATHYMAAIFMRKVNSEETWKGILKCWIRIYLGPPDNIRVDQGSNFVSQHFKSCVEAEGITLLEAPVESPFTMSHVERYHAPLRTAYLKIRDSLPRSETDSDCLQMAVKSVNDTTGPEGLCPTLLVYGSIPRPPRAGCAETQMARARAIDSAREEVLKEINKKKVAFGLRNAGSPKGMEQEENLTKLPAGSPVMVYRNAQKKWEGPFPFVSIDGNTAVIQLPRGRKIFRSTAVKSILPLTIEKGFAKQGSTSDNSNNNGVDTACYSNLNINFQQSRDKELQGLLEIGAFETVDKSAVPPKMRIYGTRWIDTYKIQPNGNQTRKSRLVACNYRDKNAADLLTKSPTISRLGQRVAVTTAALFPQNQAYTRDISQAYIQSSTELERSVYLRPPLEMNLDKNHLLLAKRPLYGIPESGLHWFLTYHKHHTKGLQMKNTTVDKCLLYTNHSSALHGITALQVDDSFGHGNTLFLQKEEENCKVFQKLKSKPRILLTEVTFNGSNITRLLGGGYKLHQSDKLRQLEIPENDEDMGTVRAQIQYIATCTRPDLCSPSQMLAAAVNNPDRTVCRKLTKLVRWAKDTADVGLQYQNLDLETLRIMLFTDASFANNRNLKSQLGFIILLTDKHSNANVIHFGSSKCYRVTRSVLASELHALVYGFDQAYTVQNQLQEILNHDIPIDVFVDSKTLFNVVARHGDTREKRLQIDINSLREGHTSGEMRHIYWIPGSQNIADALTKDVISASHALWTLMKTNRIHITPSGWNMKVINN